MTSRNGDFIGDRYVKLLRVPHEEMEEQAAGLLLTAAASHSDSSAAAVAVAALNFQVSFPLPAHEDHLEKLCWMQLSKEGLSPC
jgi:hypothetical protein